MARLTEEQINTRCYPNKYVGYDEISKKYILQAPDGYIFKKSSPHLKQGDPRGKSGKTLQINDINDKLRSTGFEIVGEKPKNLKFKTTYRHSCGNIQKAKFHRLYSGKTKCHSCNKFQPTPKQVSQKTCTYCNKIMDDRRLKYCSQQCIVNNTPKTKSRIYTNDEIDQVETLKKQGLTISEISKITGVNRNTVKRVTKQLKLYLDKQTVAKNSGEGKRKGQAKAREFTSNDRKDIQVELRDYIVSILPDSEVISNSRGIIPPQELDVVIPDKGIAFEMNGLYYHSSKFKNDNFHNSKRIEANKKGYRLIHVYEDEWVLRKDQVKGFIKSVLGKNSTRIMARKCQAISIDPEKAKEFNNLHHIQKLSLTQKYSFGLIYEGELLAVMLFNRHHRDNCPNTISLSRMAFKSDVTVIGGASKLLNYAKEFLVRDGYKEIVTWSDNRWSEGKVYESIGLALKNEYQPSYDYYKTGLQRIPKQSLNKTKLIQMGGTGNTEREMASSLGYYRIYDCGKKSWSIKLLDTPR